MLLRTPKDVGAIVRQRRRELGIAQHTLAELVGASRQWIIDCEKGKPRAELGLVLRTLTALGVRLRAAVEQPKSALDAPDIDAIVAAARALILCRFRCRSRRGLDGNAENEHFCLSLARELGMPAAHSRI